LFRVDYALHAVLGADSSLTAVWVPIMLIFVGLTYLFAILGFKTNRTGFLVAAAFMAFFGTAATMVFQERLLIAVILVVLYIIMIVLSTMNTNEYKRYETQHKTV